LCRDVWIWAEQACVVVDDQVRKIGEDERAAQSVPVGLPAIHSDDEEEWDSDRERMHEDSSARNEPELVGQWFVNEVWKLTADEDDGGQL